eukprot:scaffold66976_cov18-Tisochrysis_lutea.AAC.2
MAIVRLGTCGAAQPPAKLGDMLVASAGSIAIRYIPACSLPSWHRELAHFTFGSKLLLLRL